MQVLYILPQEQRAGSVFLQAKGPAVFVHEKDVVDEAISFFRANVLFRNFEVKGPADKLLLYLTLYISACLKSESLCALLLSSWSSPVALETGSSTDSLYT